MKKQGLFTISPNRAENGSYPSCKFGKPFAKLKKESLLIKLLKNLQLKWIQEPYEEDFEKAGLFYGRVLKVEKLTKRHKELRVEYSNEMKDYKWKRVFFSERKNLSAGSYIKLPGKSTQIE